MLQVTEFHLPFRSLVRTVAAGSTDRAASSCAARACARAHAPSERRIAERGLRQANRSGRPPRRRYHSLPNTRPPQPLGVAGLARLGNDNHVRYNTYLIPGT